MFQLNGMILFLGVAVVSALLCLAMWYSHSRKTFRFSAQGERRNKIVLHSILFGSQGVSIDDVTVNLKNEDMGGFHLSS